MNLTQASILIGLAISSLSFAENTCKDLSGNYSLIGCEGPKKSSAGIRSFPQTSGSVALAHQLFEKNVARIELTQSNCEKLEINLNGSNESVKSINYFPSTQEITGDGTSYSATFDHDGIEIKSTFNTMLALSSKEILKIRKDRHGNLVVIQEEIEKSRLLFWLTKKTKCIYKNEDVVGSGT